VTLRAPCSQRATVVTVTPRRLASSRCVIRRRRRMSLTSWGVMARTIPLVSTARNVGRLLAAAKMEPPAWRSRQRAQETGFHVAIDRVGREAALVGELLDRQHGGAVEGRARDNDRRRRLHGREALRQHALLARHAQDAQMHAGQSLNQCRELLEGERAHQRGDRARFHCRPRWKGTPAIRPRLHAACSAIERARSAPPRTPATTTPESGPHPRAIYRPCDVRCGRYSRLPLGVKTS